VSSPLDELFLRGDSNGDGEVDLSDAVNILNVLFLGAGRIPPPYPATGAEPATDRLGCGRIW